MCRHYSIANKKSYSIIEVAKLFKTKIKYLPKSSDFFTNFADISDKDLKFLKDKKDKEDIFILCTNQNTNIQLLKISSWNLDMFNFVITSEEVGYEKPNRNFFQYVVKIIKDFDRNKYNFFAVGDDYENDIKFWKNNYDARSYLIDNSNKRWFVRYYG